MGCLSNPGKRLVRVFVKCRNRAFTTNVPIQAEQTREREEGKETRTKIKKVQTLPVTGLKQT